MFKHLLSITAGLHKYLQRETVDLAQALQYKSAVYGSLNDLHTTQTAEESYMNAKVICDAVTDQI